MKRVSALGLFLLSAGAAAYGCSSSVLLGSFESEAAGSGGSGALGGAAGAPALFEWRANFETGDLSEFEPDGGTRFRVDGSVAVSTEQAHSGENALLARITTLEDEAFVWHQVPSRVRLGAWYFIPEDYDTDYWVILKLGAPSSTETLTNVFDIDIATVAPGEYCLLLWEHGGPNEILRSALTFPTGQWFHLEVVFEASTNDDGILRVLQDGAEVMNTGRRATIPLADGVTVAWGSVSYAIDPLPAQLWLDDLSVTELE